MVSRKVDLALSEEQWQELLDLHDESIAKERELNDIKKRMKPLKKQVTKAQLKEVGMIALVGGSGLTLMISLMALFN